MERVGRLVRLVVDAVNECNLQTNSGSYAPRQSVTHRLRCAFAAATVQEWRRVPDRPARILARQPVLGETMEIHPTRGTCNYRCAMCLWSDQQSLTYQTKQLASGRLMTAKDWCRVLAELHHQGVRRLVVSGGGEALINPQST